MPDASADHLPRRHFLAASAASAAALALTGCPQTPEVQGSFTGIQQARGHLLREPGARLAAVPAVQHRTRVLIAGGGVAGLAAARALRLAGMQDFVLLELEDEAGGNARAGSIAGMAHPLGAHYLPVPGDDAHEVQDLLEELGLRQRQAGRWQYDERHLCHSPQERLFLHGAWQEGLLPLQGVAPGTLAQYQRFAALVEQARKNARWSLPAYRSAHSPFKQALASISFASWLQQNSLDDAYLRWYLDYCCRDDFGAGCATVSAWAGLHYFASRHGFQAPGGEAPRDGLLTWPEGNAWITRRMATLLGERLRTGQVVLRVQPGKHSVEVDVLNSHSQQLERWQAERLILALPLFVAARVLQNPPDFLREQAARTAYAPWLVANIHIEQPLWDRKGPAPSWDNVLYGDTSQAPGLGYVDAMHQSLLPVRGRTVLSYYRALGDGVDGRGTPQQGRALLQQPWTWWRDAILQELAQAHPDLPSKARRIDITRYGHAMAIPRPDPRGTGPQVPPLWGRIAFAHSDWAGYSVFEEAFALGQLAGSRILA